MVTIDSLVDKGAELAVAYVPKLVLAILTLVIGLWVIRWIVKGFGKGFDKRNIDATLKGFLMNIIGILLKVMLFIAVIGMVGVQTSSFVAVLAAMGFAIGLALQGSLGNFAGGVLIMLFKPIAKDEYIEAQGEAGTVTSIEIFTTTLLTPDNKTVTIPNGPLANGNIVNYSRQKTRRVDFKFGISYDDDMKKAQKILSDIVKKHKLVLKEPEPFVRVGELGDSSVNFTVRIWTKTQDYWTVYFDVTENVKERFDKEGISIPYPQTDLHLYQKK